MTARAPASRQTSDCTPMLRFPCGHVELEQVIQRRTRSRAAALWVRCARCNLIALVVSDPTEPDSRPPSA